MDNLIGRLRANNVDYVSRGDLVRDMREAAGEIERLRAALDRCLVGGNHLANVLINCEGGDFAQRLLPDMEPRREAAAKLVARRAGRHLRCWSALIARTKCLYEQKAVEK